MKTERAPVVIGALGSMLGDLKHWFEVLGISPKIKDLQKIIILHSAKIIWKVVVTAVVAVVVAVIVTVVVTVVVAVAAAVVVAVYYYDYYYYYYENDY